MMTRPLPRHEFVGRLDRWCQVDGCNLPDRHPIHQLSSIEQAITEIKALADADARAERIRIYNLPSRQTIERDIDDREAIFIHPQVRQALRQLLMYHPRYKTSGIGYSEFIRQAIERELYDA